MPLGLLIPCSAVLNWIPTEPDATRRNSTPTTSRWLLLTPSASANWRSASYLAFLALSPSHRLDFGLADKSISTITQRLTHQLLRPCRFHLRSTRHLVRFSSRLLCRRAVEIMCESMESADPHSDVRRRLSLNLCSNLMFDPFFAFALCSSPPRPRQH